MHVLFLELSLSFITQLFMTIFSFHLYPTCWMTTLVNAIFKQKGIQKFATSYRPISLAQKGIQKSATSYRPITLTQLLDKLFDFVIAGRFTKWFKYQMMPRRCIRKRKVVQIMFSVYDV